MNDRDEVLAREITMDLIRAGVVKHYYFSQTLNTIKARMDIANYGQRAHFDLRVERRNDCSS
jgi:hypothetical protein